MDPSRRVRALRTAAVAALVVAACAVPVAFLPLWGSAGGRLVPLALIPGGGGVAVALAVRLLTAAARHDARPARADVALLVLGAAVALLGLPALLGTVVLVAGP